MSTPVWGLTLAYWLHMLATVVWLGSLASFSLLVLPSARRSLEPVAYAALLGELQRRLGPLGWFSMAVLAGTGMVQLSANPNYQGFLAIENHWAVAILLKHILFLVMVGLAAYITWGIFPQLRRLALQQSRSQGSELAGETERLRCKEARLLQLNLVLGVLVLALTAVARAA